MSEPFVAEIKMFGCNYAPRGYAFCDGQLIPISQNSVLFSLVGTTYGGDGRTTCALPDLRGRAPMHPGSGPGLSQRQCGQKTGRETVTLTVNEIPHHTHNLVATGVASNSNSPIDKMVVKKANSEGAASFSSAGSGNMDGNVLEDAGGNQPHENLQPYLGLNFCIALQGILPPRS